MVAYCAVADRLADQTMTALAEGDEIWGGSAPSCWLAGGPAPARFRFAPAGCPARHSQLIR